VTSTPSGDAPADAGTPPSNGGFAAESAAESAAGSGLALPDQPAPPVRTGLEPEERSRLNDLRAAVERRPYPFILGSDWDVSRDESERKAALLSDWLKTLAARPNLDGDTRAAVRTCLAQVELAGFVLRDPELGPAYIRAARERHKRAGAA